jgi:hypothetical protein
MSRRMWPYEAVVPFNVRATYKQAGSWEYAAGRIGVKVPVFLALAADAYYQRLERRIARDERKRAREAKG